MPEILGEVDEATHTRGYIVATTGSGDYGLVREP
jgi:hypothetical protein